MKTPRWTLRAAALLVGVLSASTTLTAQGVTTGGIGGTVSSDRAPIEGAQITITNRATGFVASARSRSNGAYLIQGLEVGGPYSVNVRRLGSETQTKDGIIVTLSSITRVDFQLATAAQVLAGITATGERSGALITPSRMGIGTTITDTMVSRLPSLNRDFVDFARLTPQIAVVPGSGLSGGGANNRFNSIQIDGASESDLFGIGSTGTPGSSVGAKSISVESVKEYQVLLSPFDVRQGNFTGALINAVSKSGTNTVSGSAYGFLRDQQITRTQDYLTAFNQKQYGFTLGGPIVKDKMFFFVNPEFQTQRQPTSGPFIGSSDSPINQTTVDNVNAALTKYGITGGTGDIIPQDNPLTNVFARLDFNLPYSSRLKLSHNYSDGDKTSFSRSTTGDFRLTSNAFDFSSTKNASNAQLFTNWASGATNELSAGYTTIRDFRTVPQAIAQVTVTVPRTLGSGGVPVVAGTERSSQGNSLDQNILEIADNITIPFLTHNITFGTKNFIYYTDNLFAQDRYGTWVFQSLDSLNGTCTACAGTPLASSYTVRSPIGEQATSKFHSATYGLFVQDQWKIRPTMNLIAGLRADIPVFKDKPPMNDAFFTEYDTLTGTRSIGGGRRTDEIPSGNIEWSPRFGFNWDVTGDERNQLRLGSGVFSGPPAYVWLSNAFGNSGVSGFPALTCNNAGATSRPPTFSAAAVTTPPQQCGGATGATAAVAGTINLLSTDLHFPQSWKSTIGFDHRFASTVPVLHDLVGTVEGQYTRGLYTPFYSNLALIEPDPATPANINSQGRLMYGTLAATGATATPNRRTARQEVYDVTNSTGDYSYQLTTGLTKRYGSRWEGALFYTYTQAFDVQSTGNSTAGSNFGLGRIISGGSLLDQTDLQHSRWEMPHRVVANGTYTFPIGTAVTAIWTGNSGLRYTYYHSTDENADGQANDAIYIPRDVRDVNEIRFAAITGTNPRSVAQQQDAFDAFIKNIPCVDAQRGHIMTRNSCSGPWMNVVDVSVRQPIRTMRGQNFTLQWDVFNFANLLNDQWGLIREGGADSGFPGQRLLTRVSSQTINGVITPSYQLFNADQQFYTFRNIQSNYRMQFSLRYSF